MNRHVFGLHLLGFFGFLAVMALFGGAVMFLWNALMSAIFGLPPLNYGQAAGILLLARILLGVGGRRGFPHGAMREKWMNMTAEERKNFAAKFHGYHHGHFSRFHLWEEQEKKQGTEEPGKEGNE
ncbi:MAG: hypothetical protein LBQ61_00895 [Spirochaetales bacterium]|jgi:hypothetical protein|nr:hypothetical protein [Spirochaetales bacterium]